MFSLSLSLRDVNVLGTNVSVGPPPQDAASILLAGHPFKLPDRLLAWDISDIPKFSLT